MIGVGYAIGFSFHAGIVQAVASMAMVSAFGLALSWIFAFRRQTRRAPTRSTARVPLPLALRWITNNG